MWEEPCISGENGSGTVFFSGCNLGCVYCQNRKISAERFGKAVTEDRLYDIFLELIDKGAHNINLVSPSHYAHVLIRVLDRPLPVPVIWNTGGYDSTETLRALDGKVQIYLTDLKYSDNCLAEKYSAARDYPETAKAAIEEMYRQRGNYVLDENGIMKSGVIIRHLVLPHSPENSKGVIDWVSSRFSDGQVLFSLMSQYTPAGEISAFPELSKRLEKIEYDSIYDYLLASGISDGFFQELSSAEEEYIPDFDLSGI